MGGARPRGAKTCVTGCGVVAVLVVWVVARPDDVVWPGAGEVMGGAPARTTIECRVLIAGTNISYGAVCLKW